MGTNLKRGRLKRLCSLSLALVMTLSLSTAPVSAAADPVAPALPDDLSGIVDVMKEHIDGESAFDYLSYVYLGWRTTGGSWQNQVIESFIGKQMEEAGYKPSDQDLSTDSEADDFFYVQHDSSTSLVWSPEYARLEITDIKVPQPEPSVSPEVTPSVEPVVPPAEEPAGDPVDPPAEEPAGDPVDPPAEEPAGDPVDPPVEEPAGDPVDPPAEEPVANKFELTSAEPAEDPAPAPDELTEEQLKAIKDIFDVESYAFDPTSDIYQAYYNDKYDLGVDLDTADDDAFIDAMWEWITEKDANGERVHVFPDGHEPGDPRGEEAELNKRAHLTWNTSFNASEAEIEAVRADPANLRDHLEGKTGQIVYVGNVSRFEGDTSALAGKILLCDSNNRSNFTFAKNNGAIAVMSTAALEYYHHPQIEDTPWYGQEDADKWYSDSKYGEENEWYSDSGRYASGAGAASNQTAMKEGKPVVEWNISKQQYAILRELIDAGYEIEANVASMGRIYEMNDVSQGGRGQLTAIAEIKGSKYPDERVIIAAHVQEPSSNDNATGVALNIELASKMKQMVDDGILPRPERTITFLWGDEMSFSSLYLQAHEDLIPKMICSIDLDMTGEDPAKTGGSMRIEKLPDPSAYYTYLLDVIPEDGDYLKPDGTDPDGNFARTPDSHTLWGAGSPSAVDIGGNFLNDLYMASAQTVVSNHNEDFEVDVCPYEGGSDHTRFLQRGVPAVLTWHFTDYVYHTTVDTLYMSSAQELEDVGITSLAAGYHAANPTEAYTKEVMEFVYQAAVDRFEIERNNSDRHAAWVKGDPKNRSAAAELAQEKEVLTAWGDWYKEAIASCGKYYKNEFKNYDSLVSSYDSKIDFLLFSASDHAADVFNFGSGLDITGGKLTLKRETPKTLEPETVIPGLDAPRLSLSELDQEFTATLTVDAGPLKDIKAEDWAASLVWYLSREKSEQDPEVYPHNYTGDKLANWQVWGGGQGGDAIFEIKPVKVETKDGKVIVTLDFSTVKTLFASGSSNGINASGSRNVWQSFIGMYQLSVQDGPKTLAKTDLMVNMYDDYTRYADTRTKLAAIQEAALKNGRYLEIVENGQSEAGRDVYYAVFSDSKASVDAFREMNATAETDPASLQTKIDDGTIGEYRVPFLINNVHSDECPGVDGQLSMLYALATEETIDYKTLTGYVDEKLTKETVKEMFAPDVWDLGITGLGSNKFTADPNNDNKIRNNTGVNDASELYTISDNIPLDVDEVLDNLIFIINPNENVDGRTYNSRRNGNGFDLNRDASNQTQSETRNLAAMVNTWNPVVFAELHGFMTQFLVEPCTPPHEPNMEYDILVKNFMLGAEAYGKAALGSISGQFPDTKFWSYYTPLRDDYDPKTTRWSAWDDLCTNYGPSYAMLNCGSMGYTIETPYNNQASSKLFEYGMYGLIDYVVENKDDIYRNQLEFFRRGLENEDHRSDMEKWYVDVSNNKLASDTWRVPYKGNDNYFPEYYVLPVDAASQRDPADAYEMGEFLIRNGVKLSQLTADTTVGDTTYQAGSLVVDMAQAKRNYANAVLWRGADASASGFPKLYSESVSNFPEMRGFDCIAIDTPDAFKDKLKSISAVQGTSQLDGVTGKAVVISNNGNEAVRAVNAMLDAKVPVGMITEGGYKGDFIIDYDDYVDYRNKFVLAATGVSEMPVAYEISQPTIFLAGRYDPFSGYKITSGYYAQWFKDGYGFIDYANIHSNETSNADVMAYTDQLHFKVTSDPSKADVILGSVALDQGETGAAAVEAVKAGTPYIASGHRTLSYINKDLIPGELATQGHGQEALHHVTYSTDSLTTASYAADGDDVIYSYNCNVLTKYPDDAEVLIQAADEDAFIAGCALNELGPNKTSIPMDGLVEAISLKREGLDLTIFANSIVNRTHQQDDYRFVTNTIYSKMLSDEPMKIDMSSSSGGSSGGSGGGSSSNTGKTTVKNDDGSTTVTVTDKKTGTVTATTTYPDGAKAETVTTKDGKITATVTLPKGKDSATVTLPMPKPGAGMVAKVVNADGTETILPWSAPADGGLKVTVNGSGTVKLTVSDNSRTFGDVASGHWASEAVQFVTSRELFLGTGEGAFSPSDSMSRAMLVTVLHRLQGTPAGGSVTFPDVSGGTWYTDAVAWASSNDIVMGTGDGFDPDGSITRESLAVMLYRYAQFRGIDVTKSAKDFAGYTDSGSVSGWADEAMRWAVGSGIISGKDGGRLDPTGTATRAEVATILMRFLSF